ncbi:class I lanthipeptide [Spirosoma spitsbergense]|jgi:hypothetical protein|uniref:class I lanthipeptide n=1 Tax=Spirosoma spitsbergense TaxID=431554 RepID=UPI00037054E7|nr:class I lanthipeptide [Spirosoma spitsbergense]
MKKKQITLERLTLDKETIARLNDEQLREVAGGMGTFSCKSDELLEEEALAGGTCCKASCGSNPC